MKSNMGFVTLFCIFLYLPVVIRSECEFQMENNPVLVKDFGSKKIIIDNIESLQMDEYESIKVFCAHQISIRSNYYGEKSIHLNRVELYCMDNNLMYGNDGIESVNAIVTVSCIDKPSTRLFESSKKLPNCGKYMSVGIGNSLIGLKDIVLAGVCYDWDALSIKFVNYFTHHTKMKLEEKNQTLSGVQTVTLDKSLSDYKSYFKFFSTNEFQDELNTLKSHNEILKFHDFDLSNIIQEDTVSKDLKSFEDILNIIWWKNLRLGSWKLLNEIIQSRQTLNHQYMVYVGTEGVLSIPQTNCYKNLTLKFENNNAVLTAPEYIWSYLISTNASISEEFVVIGYNSPYASFKAGHNPIFCPDICDEIYWLKSRGFSEVRLMPTQGIVFCCRPEDVAKKFSNFPLNITDEIATTTIKPDVPTFSVNINF